MEDKSQLRNFVFTWNNPMKELVDLTQNERFAKGRDYLELLYDSQKLNIQYICFGEEYGEKGTPHYQGYVELAKRHTFSRIKEHFVGMYLAKCAGTQQQNIAYCRKGGRFTSFGTPKVQGHRTDLQYIKSMLESSRSIKTLIEDNTIKSYQQLRVAQSIWQYLDKPRSKKPDVLWICGPTGIGKTRLARELLPVAYFKDTGTGKWWTGYNGETDIILDDFRDDIYPFSYMLGLLDRYPFRIEGKGTTIEFQGLRIIITAPKPPSDYYADILEDQEQLIRRIDQIISMKPNGEIYKWK